MIVNTSAIVLKTFPYGETSLISRCFTKEKGKVSFIIKGARSKRNLIAPYFQPLSYIQMIYNENEKRELQIVSKVDFVNVWLKISTSLKKMTLLQTILEITDFTLEINDPHPTLFASLIEVINWFEKGGLDPNLAFWLYESELLSEMGFRISLTTNDNEMDGYNYPTLKENKESSNILQHLINRRVEQIIFDNISSKDKKIVSNYLYKQLCYHFEGFEGLKSFQVARDVLNSA